MGLSMHNYLAMYIIISFNIFSYTFSELYVSVGGTHPGIARMKTDGSEFKMFVSDNIGQPTGITLDLPGKRLYWLDTKYRLIESIRLDGKGRTVVKYLTTGSNFHTISVFEDLVYWTQKSSSNIFVANRFTGETVRTISAGLSISPGFKLVHEVLQISGKTNCLAFIVMIFTLRFRTCKL